VLGRQGPSVYLVIRKVFFVFSGIVGDRYVHRILNG